MKYRKNILLGIVCLSMFFASCNGGNDERISLELFSTKGENAKTLQKLANQFSQQQGGKITINVVSPADASTVLRSRLAKNDIPDILAVGGDTTYTELASSGVLMDLSYEPFISQVHGSYLQMLYDVNKNHGRHAAYAIPYATNCSGIIYNSELFEKAGVEVPESWSELLNVVNQLKKSGIQPFELTFLDAWTCLPPWNSMVPVLQPKNFIQDKNAGKTSFANTHTEVLQKYLTLLKNSSGNDFMGTSYNDGNKDFAEGKVAMLINGNWAIPEIMKVNPDAKVDMFAFPTTDDPQKNTMSSGIDVALAISSSTQYKDSAKQFLTFMVTPQTAQTYVDEQFAFSAIKSVDQNDPTVAGCKEIIAAGRVSDYPDHSYPSGFDLTSILSQFALNYSSGMNDQQNITETLEDCDRQYDAVNVQ